VFAIGSPFGLKGTVSNGVVSAIRNPNEFDLDAVTIQTTAAISHGNSGGPLLNVAGDVVGVMTFSRRGGENLNFAVAAEHVVDLLKTAKSSSRPWYELPTPRHDSPAEPGPEKVPALPPTNEQAKIAAEKFAAAIKDAQEKHDQKRAVQGELDRIVARAGDITKAISLIEVEGTALTAQRGQVMATATGVIARGVQVEAELARLQNSVSNAQFQLQRAIKHEFFDQIPGLRQDIARLEPQVFSLSQEYSTLKASTLALDQQARALAQQISDKLVQREHLVNELNLLRERYDQIHAQ
jgi:hypothetical protein